MPPKTIGLIAHTGKKRHCRSGQCHRSGVRSFFDFGLARNRNGPPSLEKSRAIRCRNWGAAADLLVVAGGDGTILRVVGQLGEVIKPIFGINVGSLGFLTCASSSTYREAVECIAKDRINFSQRALLEARVRLGEKQTAKMIALNDAVLSRGELSRLETTVHPNQRGTTHRIQCGRSDCCDAYRFHRILALRRWPNSRSGVWGFRDHADLPACSDESIHYRRKTNRPLKSKRAILITRSI